MSEVNHKITIPDVGDHDKLEILNWLIKEGEDFKEGDEICELSTDKAVFPLEAEKDGRLIKISQKAPAKVKINQEIGEFVYYIE